MSVPEAHEPRRDDLDREAVLAANAAFYEAFERRDMAAMDAAWEHSDRCFCTHPGWPSLRGWEAVSRSWAGLLANAQRLQFILTNVVVQISGDAAWVLCDENVLDTAGRPDGSTVAACNVFSRDRTAPSGWRLVGHHGSLVHSSVR